MRFWIKSRPEIEKKAESPFEECAALISITDAGASFAKLKNPPAFLLQVAFDDVDNDVFVDELGRKPTEAERHEIEKKYNMLSDEKAKEIADFYFSVCEKATLFICQCEHGQSRSAAVAAAILEFRSKGGIRIFADDRYYPNKAVFKKVLSALQSAKRSEEA